MARRPSVTSDAKLSAAQPIELRQRLAGMTRNEAERHYHASHNACRLDVYGRLPSPKLIQELVQVCKRSRGDEVANPYGERMNRTGLRGIGGPGGEEEGTGRAEVKRR